MLMFVNRILVWDIICQPKDWGDLAVKNFISFNDTCLLKWRSKIICGIKVLWSKVLKRKYARGAQWHRETTSNNMNLRFGKIWVDCDLFLYGLRWILGNERMVNFWHNHWILDIPSLFSCVISLSFILMDNVIVVDLVEPSKEWDWFHLCNFLNQPIYDVFWFVKPPTHSF